MAPKTIKSWVLPPHYSGLMSFLFQIKHMMAFIEQEANEKAEEIDAKVPYSHIFWAGADITWLVISVFHNVLVAVCPRAGRRRVQHREGPAGADPAAEDNGVLREEGEAD